ncbi:uncharacterized protein VTP21DRAFT_3603 [Calcarisporiella thermophila]|uniref:uncharacterized protein n=1 Tax=Calcarisporiella thermophila TaxID=911321 RepID=UPI0037442F4C
MSPTSSSQRLTPTSSARSHSKEQSGFSEEKYKQLKRKLKEVLQHNDVLAEELARAQKKIRQLKKEKSVILDRLTQVEGWGSAEEGESHMSPSEAETGEMTPAFTSTPKSSPPPTSAPSLINPSSLHTRKAPSGKRHPSQTSSQSLHYSHHTAVPDVPLPTAEALEKAKSKAARPVRGRIRRAHPVDKDESGNYILPVQIGILTVHSLGHIVYDRDTFHSARYLWPVGFRVSRPYMSTLDPDKQVIYHCEIVDGGDAPKFIITPDDRRDRPIIANSATGAWTSVVREANAIRKREHSNSASGPDYYGFTHPTISKMIQDLPNANLCRNYIWQDFQMTDQKLTSGVPPQNSPLATSPGAAHGSTPGSAPATVADSADSPHPVAHINGAGNHHPSGAHEADYPDSSGDLSVAQPPPPGPTEQQGQRPGSLPQAMPQAVTSGAMWANAATNVEEDLEDEDEDLDEVDEMVDEEEEEENGMQVE